MRKLRKLTANNWPKKIELGGDACSDCMGQGYNWYIVPDCTGEDIDKDFDTCETCEGTGKKPKITLLEGAEAVKEAIASRTGEVSVYHKKEYICDMRANVAMLANAEHEPWNYRFTKSEPVGESKI